jgi:anti-sigma factor RsiW
MEAVLAAECERARKWASLAVDCELSELGKTRLQAHLRSCPACAEYAGGLKVVTRELRAAPLPTPSRPLVPQGPRRRRRLPIGLAAIAIVVAAAFGGLAGTLRPTASSPQVKTSSVRLAALFRPTASPTPGGRVLRKTPL